MSLALAPSAAPPAGLLTGTQRAAVLLVTAGIEAARHVLPLLSDAEVERLSVEIAHLRRIPAAVVEDVLKQFQEEIGEAEVGAEGGKSVVEEMLSGAFGEERAGKMLAQLEGGGTTAPPVYARLDAVEIGPLADFLMAEHPQTVAVVLSRLNPAKAAQVLKRFGAALRSDVSYRLATLGEPAPEVLAEIEAILRAQLDAGFGGGAVRTSAQHVATILGGVGKRMTGEVLEALQERAPALAEEVKSHMFVFDDFEQVSDRDLQRVLAEIDQRDVALSLKGAGEALAERMLANVSERMRDSIREEMSFMGPARVSEVEEAQQRIVDRAQTLEEEGLVALTSGAEQLEPMI